MIIVIIGPTGIGKTKLSVELAKRYKTEIISGDSVQVYRDLNIGSAKISEAEKGGIVHHLIDIMDPTEDFSVALFQKMVREKIKNFELRGITPIIVGGTGLYIKSVLYDYNFSQSARNKELEKTYQDLSNEELHKILVDKDLESSLLIHPNNRKRVLQAITRSESNKVSLNKNKDHALYDFKIIGLTTKREVLYEIINNRVDKMIKDGLIEEVKSLFDRGIHSNSVSAIGYKELYAYFNNELSLEEAVSLIKQHSRNLAKKQITFFNNQFDVKWINVDFDDFQKTINDALTILSK